MTRSGKHPASRTNKRRWEILILVAVFAVPALVLLPVVHLRTGFTASLRTKSIQFQTSDRQGKSVGLFDPEAPLELTIERFGRIESQEGTPPTRIVNPSGQASVTFLAAQFHSLDIHQPLRVSLDADDGKMSMAIEPLRSDEHPIATLITGGESQFSCDECVVEGADGKPVPEESVIPSLSKLGANPAGLPRTWSVYVKKDSRLHLQLRAMKGRIPAEHKIHLAKNSSVTFDLEGQSVIVGDDGEVQITGVDRKPLKLKEGQSLVLGELEGDPREDDPMIESLEPEAADVKVDLRGSSRSILLDKSNEAATPAEYLTSQKPLAAYFTTVALIGSTVLTILTRLKLIKKPED
jgi:hypothetical protein